MFRELVDVHEWRMIGFDEKHFPDKRWLLDVIATYAPLEPTSSRKTTYRQ